MSAAMNIDAWRKRVDRSLATLTRGYKGLAAQQDALKEHIDTAIAENTTVTLRVESKLDKIIADAVVLTAATAPVVHLVLSTKRWAKIMRVLATCGHTTAVWLGQWSVALMAIVSNIYATEHRDAGSALWNVCNWAVHANP